MGWDVQLETWELQRHMNTSGTSSCFCPGWKSHWRPGGLWLRKRPAAVGCLTSVSQQDWPRPGGEMVGMLELCLLWQGNLWRMKVDVLTYLALAAVSFVAMVTGGRSSSRRKHKDVFLGENSKFKFGGWDRLAVRSVCSYWGSLRQ